METSDQDSSAATLAAYEGYAAQYIERTSIERSSLVDDLIALTSGGSSVLELGSGPGRDAAALEAAGLVVHRTDGAVSFVERFHLAGLEARILNVHADDFAGPYDAVFANAVLLHVSLQLPRVLEVALHATRVGGVLAASFKKGTGEDWSAKKLDAPRHFTYWQEEDLRRVVLATGWTPSRSPSPPNQPRRSGGLLSPRDTSPTSRASDTRHRAERLIAVRRSTRKPDLERDRFGHASAVVQIGRHSVRWKP